MDELNIKRTKIDPKDIENEEQDKQIPHWSQRIAAGLIDLGLLIVLMFGFVKLMRMTPLGHDVEIYQERMAYIQKDYALTPLLDGSNETFAVKVYIDDTNKDDYKDYIKYYDEPNKIYTIKVNEDLDKELLKKLQVAYKTELNKDSDYTAAKFNSNLVNYGIYVISISMAEAILILGIPLIIKRRVTLGQLAAGLRCINSNVPSSARWYKIVGRYFYVMIFEVALPLLGHLRIYSILLVPLISYIISLFSKQKRCIRDFVTRTRFVDNKNFVTVDSSKQIKHTED